MHARKVQRVKVETGLDVAGRQHVIASDYLRHIEIEHGPGSPDGHVKVAVVELGRDGNSYRVLTAGLRNRDSLPIEPLWQKGREPSEPPAGEAPPALSSGPAKTGEPSDSASGQSGP